MKPSLSFLSEQTAWIQLQFEIYICVSLNTCIFDIPFQRMDGPHSMLPALKVIPRFLRCCYNQEPVWSCMETEVRWDQIVLGCLLDDNFQGKIEDWHPAPSNVVHFQKLFLHISILVLMNNVFLACWHTHFRPTLHFFTLDFWSSQFYDKRNPWLYTLAYNIHEWTYIKYRPRCSFTGRCSSLSVCSCEWSWLAIYTLL